MYLTSTVYQHPFLVQKDNPNVHPVFIGPTLLHKDATSETYSQFFTKIRAQLDNGPASTTLSPLIMGSDQEGAITKARKQVFPEAHSVFCTLHVRKDMKRQMERKNVSKDDQKCVNSAFFGKNGLFESKDSQEFLTKKEFLLDNLEASRDFV